MLAVANEKRLVSRIFLNGVLTYFFLIKAMRVLTSMKPAPIIPVIVPRIIADGKLEIGDFNWVTLPNFKTEALLNVTSYPSYKLVRMARVSVEIAEAKKTNQSILKVQKVVGLEISKVKSAPPIGDPKAAETPALAPAAIN